MTVIATISAVAERGLSGRAEVSQIMCADRSEQLELQASGAYFSPEAVEVFRRHREAEEALRDMGTSAVARGRDFAVAQHRASWPGTRRGASYRGYLFSLTGFPKHPDALAWWFKLDEFQRWEFAMGGYAGCELGAHKVARAALHMQRMLPLLEEAGKALADLLRHHVAGGDWSEWSLERIVIVLSTLRDAAAERTAQLAEQTPALHRAGRIDDWRAAVQLVQQLDQAVAKLENRILTAGLKKICERGL